MMDTAKWFVRTLSIGMLTAFIALSTYELSKNNYHGVLGMVMFFWALGVVVELTGWAITWILNFCLFTVFLVSYDE